MTRIIKIDSRGWIFRIMRFVCQKISLRKDCEETLEAERCDSSKNPSIVRNNLNRKSWETLYDDFDPVGDDFLAERPLNVEFKD